MYLIQKFMKFYIYQKLNQTINNNIIIKYLYKFNFINNYFILNIIILNINIFYFCIRDKIMSKNNKALIIDF